MKKPETNKLIAVITSFFLCFLIGGCLEVDTVQTTGKVVYVDIEGGFYGIIGDNGECYDPLNLSGEFQIDGLRIYFKGKKVKNQASYHQWGTIIEIESITKI